MNGNPRGRHPTVLWVAVGVILLLAVSLAWRRIERNGSRSATSTTNPDSFVSETGITGSFRPTTVSRGEAGLATGRPAAQRILAERILKYGSGVGQVGWVQAQEQEPLGPESFALGRNDDILVSDKVNHRIQIYARDGAFLRSVNLPGVDLGDVVSDAQGGVYVYDPVHHSLLGYDAGGAPQGSLQLNPADVDTRGYFHVVGDRVYFADAGSRDVLVAIIADGTLVAPAGTSELKSDGVHAESGRLYSVSVAKGEALRIQIRDAAAPTAPQILQLTSPDILSASFVGEDQSGRFYVQTERWVGGRVALEVLTFSPVGEQLSLMQVPENDYAVWTTKLLTVAADGTLVQFLPQKEQAKFVWFSE